MAEGVICSSLKEDDHGESLCPGTYPSVPNGAVRVSGGAENAGSVRAIRARAAGESSGRERPCGCVCYGVRGAKGTGSIHTAFARISGDGSAHARGHAHGRASHGSVLEETHSNGSER